MLKLVSELEAVRRSILDKIIEYMLKYYPNGSINFAVPQQTHELISDAVEEFGIQREYYITEITDFGKAGIRATFRRYYIPDDENDVDYDLMEFDEFSDDLECLTLDEIYDLSQALERWENEEPINDD